MASQKRLPKPKGESDCSRRTATVPVTCFIDVKRNATTKTGYEGACSCSVRMRSVNADSALQARRSTPSPFAKRTGNASRRSDRPAPFTKCKGARASAAMRAGDARSRSERSLPLSHKSSPLRRAEPATVLTRG